MGEIKRRVYKRELFESYYLKHAKRKKYKRFVCMNIIKGINELVMDFVYKGGEFEFPAKVGSISIVGIKHTPFYLDGKLIPAKPIDWGATRKLWAEDEDAKKKKMLVRFTSDYFYRFLYKRHPYGMVQCWAMKIEAYPQRKKELFRLIKQNKLFVHTKEF